jgi:hypothetical protein
MDTDPGGRRFAAAEGPDSPVFAFKAQLAIACDSLRLLAIYALLAWAFRRFSQAVQRSAAVKRQVACTCMYLRLYRYRPGLDQPQHGEDFNAKA